MAATGGAGDPGGVAGTGATGGTEASAGAAGAGGVHAHAGAGGGGATSITVPVRFTIDDTAGRTYGADAGLAWKGTFSWDADANLLTSDPSWAGPFPPLFDDGSHGDVTAADGLWSIEVGVSVLDVEVTTESECQALAAPYTWDTDGCGIGFEYGAIRGSIAGADGDWIWTGPSGTFRVLAGTRAPVVAPGLVVAAPGTIDARIELDLSAVHSDFQGFDPSTGTVALKSAVMGWSEVLVADDGTHGDTTAADGIYTFLFSNVLGPGSPRPDAGLLEAGADVAFVWVLDGVEYRNLGVAHTDGVTVYTDAGAPGTDACVALTAACALATLDVDVLGSTFFTVPAG